MSTPPDSPQFTRRELKKRARQWFPVLIRSMATRTLLFVLVLFAIGMTCKPWKWEWLRPDEAASIAEQFLHNQGVKLDEYTLIQAAEYKFDGVWNADMNPHGFGYVPAVGYVNRYFHAEERDNSWNIHVSPAGNIYNVLHNVDDYEPGQKLTKLEALSAVYEQIGARLGIAVDHLVMKRDSLAQMPQRYDYFYTFYDSLGGPYSKLYDVRLTGNTLTSFAVRSTPAAIPHSERPPGARLRLLAFALMVFGVFQIILHHRHPISWRRGMWWGSVAMIIVLIARTLTMSQATLLVPGGSEAEDFIFRVALAAAVEALQSGIVVTLIVASGESISRDIMPNITTLTRIAPSHRGWTGAWIQSARWALPAAALFLSLEAWLGRIEEPGGLAGESLRLVADVVGSPLPALAGPVLVAKSILWEELVFRLWLFPLLIFWVRGTFTAMLIMAGLAAYFVGFDTSQWLSTGAAHWFAWSLMAAWLFMRVGILGALMFHALVLGGFLALALVWIGFTMPVGVFLITLIVGSLAAVAIQAEVVVSRSAENT